jgi:hypothetical protein
MFRVFAVLLAVLFLAGCSAGASESRNDIWIGSYEFHEIAQLAVDPELWITPVWSYSIELYESGQHLYADIKIDGHSTLKRIRAKALPEGDDILFEFYEYIIDEDGNRTIFKKHEKGDVLLRFQRQGDDIITVWGTTQPQLTENEFPGIYFVKAHGKQSEKPRGRIDDDPFAFG